MSPTIKHIQKIARESSYLARMKDSGELVNLAGDYDYLSAGYYVSQDLELSGTKVHPTCKESLDAYVPPLFLEKAKLAQIPSPDYYISNGYFEPPVILDPINPFMIKSRVVLKSGRENAVSKSMTRNFTYAICCQELPEKCEIETFRSILGWSTAPRFRDASKLVWEVYKIPLAKVRVIVTQDDQMMLSDISPLEFKKLGARELGVIQERVTWGR